MMRCWTAVIIATAIVAGCTPTAEPGNAPVAKQIYPNWPSLLNSFRFHWTAAQDIDMTAGPAVIVRSYIESYQIANMTFDLDNVYPGFLRATPENQPTAAGGYRSELTDIRPLGIYEHGESPTGVEHFGFNTDHILELASLENGYRAVVCTGSYSNFIRSSVRPNAYISVSTRESKNGVTPYPYSPMTGVSVRQIEITQHDPRTPAGAPNPVGEPQTGPAPAPQVDVFGNWFITGSSSVGWGPITRANVNNFPSAELRERCANAMPNDQEERREMMTGYKDEPPWHGDAIPGWPGEAAE